MTDTPADTGAPKTNVSRLYSPAAERALVALCLTFSSAREEALPVIGPADFGDLNLRAVYKAIVELHEQGLGVDVVDVVEQLRVGGVLDQVGGDQFIRQIVADIPGAAPRSFIRIISDYSVRRAAWAMGDSVQSLATDPAVAVHDLVNQIGQKASGITLPDEEGLAVPLANILRAEDEPYNWVIPGLMERKDRTIVVAPEGHGKALALNTPIPTHSRGWVSMGELTEHDKVYNQWGDPVSIRAVTEVMENRPCYKIRFSNKEMIVADAEHQWVINDSEVMTSAQMHEHLRNSPRKKLVVQSYVRLEDSHLGPDFIPARRPVRVAVMEVKPVPSVPVRCIEVDSEDGVYMAGYYAVPTHNSTLLRQVAVMAAGGLHPFDAQRRIPPIRSLIVDLENREHQIRRRLAPMADAVSLQIGGDESWMEERCHLWVASSGINLRNRSDVGNLVATVRQIKPDLITIGPLYKMASGSPNDEEVAKSIADVLDMIANKYNAALLIEAHAPHSSNSNGEREMRPYGASLWMRWSEFGLGLYPTPEGGMNVKHWRGQREEREWPSRLIRGVNWSWEVPTDQLAPMDTDPIMGGDDDILSEDF